MKAEEVSKRSFLRKLKDPRRDDAIRAVAKIKEEFRGHATEMINVRYAGSKKGSARITTVSFDLYFKGGLGLPDSFLSRVQEILDELLRDDPNTVSDCEAEADGWSGLSKNPIHCKIWFY